MGMPPSIAALLGGHPAPKPVKPAREKVFHHAGLDEDARLGDTVTIDAPRVEWLYFVSYVSTMENVPQAINDMTRHIYEVACGIDFDALNADIQKHHEEHMAEHSDMEAAPPFQLLDMNDEDRGGYM